MIIINATCAAIYFSNREGNPVLTFKIDQSVLIEVFDISFTLLILKNTAISCITSQLKSFEL